MELQAVCPSCWVKQKGFEPYPHKTPDKTVSCSVCGKETDRAMYLRPSIKPPDTTQ